MIATKIVLSLIALATAVFNVIFLYSLKKVKSKNSYIFLCINLSLSDLLQSLSGYLPELFLEEYLTDANYLCKVSAFFVMFSALTSISLLTSIALSRLILLNAPFLTQRHGFKKLFKVIGPASWVYAFFWSVLPLTGVSSFTLEPTQTRCSIKWQAKKSSEKAYLLLLLAFCYLIPICIISVSCLVTSKVIHSKFQYFSKIYGKENSETILFKAKEEQARSSFILMFVSFIICWSPYAITGILAAYTYVEMPTWILHGAALIAKSSAIFNPLIYWWKNKIKILSQTSSHKSTMSSIQKSTQ